MRFSVLVPVYNAEKYLPECLKHIAGQSFKDYEAVLIDDGSMDGSGRIADQFANADSRFRVVHKDNQGLLAARRDAIRMAEGEYLIFCDSDDFLEFDALEQINRELQREPVDILMYDAFLYKDGSGKRKEERENVVPSLIGTSIKKGRFSTKLELVQALFLTMKLQPMWIKAVRREIADAEGDYTEYYDCSYGEDMLQTSILFCNAESIRYCGQPLYYYRQSSGMMGRFSETYYEENRRIHRKVSEIFHIHIHEITETEKDLEQYLGAFLMYIAYGAYHQCSFLTSADVQSVKKVIRDPYFRRMYEAVHSSNIWCNISRHERFAVWLMYHRQYFVLGILCRLIRRIKGYSREG